MANYFSQNPAARILISDFMRLNENASVENLLKKTTEVSLDTFKKIVFDLASRESRKPDEIRSMLSDIGSAKTVKSLVAKMKDYSDESEIGDSRFAKVKNMYMTALGSVGDSLKRLVEIDGKLADSILEKFKILANRLVSSLDMIASSKAKKSKNESQFFDYTFNSLNESVAIGFNGRIERLGKKLVNLISDSKGKDAKAGYGRDWQRLFSTLEQKLESIQNSKDLTGEKDRKSLLELEKQTDSLSEEYYNYKIKATEMSMKKILDDDELVSKFSDVTELITSALDLISKANVQELMVDKNVREELEEVENRVVQKIFPIKQGAKDSDIKFKKSGIIAILQKTLMNSFPSVKKFLQKHGGANGEFNSATSVVVKSIQSSLSNKNANGELDKSLFDSLLKMEQVSEENKEALAEALNILKKSYAMSESAVLSLDFFSRINESIYIDDDTLEKELEKNSTDLEKTEGSNLFKSVEDNSKKDGSLAKNLAKNLRSGFNKNAEEEDFLKEDGTLKSSYPADFVESWIQALEESKEEEDKPAFFWVQKPDDKIGSLYSTKRLACNIKKPYNWSRWTQISGGDDPDDKDSFARWYTGYYSKFGGLEDDSREKAIVEILNFYGNTKNSSEIEPKLSDHFTFLVSTYDDLKDALRSSKSAPDSEPYEYFKRGYLTRESFQKVLEAAKIAAQVDDDEPDLNFYDFVLLTVCVFVCSSCVVWSSEDKKWSAAFPILEKKILSESRMKKIMAGKILDSDPKSPIPLLDKEGIEILKKGYDGNPKKILKDNFDRASKVLSPSVQKHADRMNYKTTEDIKSFDKGNVYVVNFD